MIFSSTCAHSEIAPALYKIIWKWEQNSSKYTLHPAALHDVPFRLSSSISTGVKPFSLSPQSINIYELIYFSPFVFWIFIVCNPKRMGQLPPPPLIYISSPPPFIIVPLSFRSLIQRIPVVLGPEPKDNSHNKLAPRPKFWCPLRCRGKDEEALSCS